ncbi:MAG: hypothetical protein ACLTYN_14750 [Dysosmobacter welbionis]
MLKEKVKAILIKSGFEKSHSRRTLWLKLWMSPAGRSIDWDAVKRSGKIDGVMLRVLGSKGGTLR